MGLGLVPVLVFSDPGWVGRRGCIGGLADVYREISPARVRGRMVAITQFNIVLGILLAFLSNFIVAGFHLGATEWRWMFGVEAFPAAAFLMLLLITPHSPRWLIARQREAEARAVLGKLGTDSGNVDEAIRQIRTSLDLEHHAGREPFFRAAYRKPIMLVIAIAAFNQLSGINAILYYAPAIFTSAGFGARAGLLNSVGLGAMNLIFTMAALAVIDHFGRRRLMLVGSIGYILSLGAIALTFYTQSSMVANDAGEMSRHFTGAGG
jgi:MFS family permease